MVCSLAMPKSLAFPALMGLDCEHGAHLAAYGALELQHVGSACSKHQFPEIFYGRIMPIGDFAKGIPDAM
jgi:hypothetical protein